MFDVMLQSRLKTKRRRRQHTISSGCVVNLAQARLQYPHTPVRLGLTSFYDCFMRGIFYLFLYLMRVNFRLYRITTNIVIIVAEETVIFFVSQQSLVLC